MSEHEQQQQPVKASKSDVFIVVGVTLIIVIALVATLLRVGGGDESVEDAPAATTGSEIASTETTTPLVVEPQLPSYPVADTVDPEVEDWHNGALPYLFRITSVLGTPLGDTVSLARVKCINLMPLVKDLRGYEIAPRADLAEKVDVWLTALEEAIEYCTQDSGQDPEELQVHTVYLTLEQSAVLWGDLLRTLASYGISLES